MLLDRKLRVGPPPVRKAEEEVDGGCDGSGDERREKAVAAILLSILL